MDLRIDKHGDTNWVTEPHANFFHISYQIKEHLFSERSEFQKVDVVDTYGYGKMLLNDGLVMVTERDEFIYHDMIAHIPLFTHPNPKNVLVIGGGDGGTAREVLRHISVESCTMVEIDGLVVEACKAHIPQTSSCLSDPRINLIIDDGVKFVKETEQKFDVVLVDSTDPIGPATPLFGPEFYADVYSCLADDGIVVSQGESPFYETKMQKKLLSILSEQFPICSIYNFHNMTYPGGLWSFTFASKKYHPIKDFDPQRVQSSGLQFGYYNEETHSGAFAIPQFMRLELNPFIKGM